MSSIGDDLRAFLAGLGQVAQGVDAAETAATSAAGKLKGIPDKVEQLSQSFDRIVSAGIEAGVSAAVGAGAIAFQGEITKESGAPSTASASVGPKAGPTAWTPAKDCLHDGTCKGPNPWKCHHDMPRKHPDGLKGPNGETEMWHCGCGPCHPPQRAKAAPTAPASPSTPSSVAAPTSPSAPPSGPGATSCSTHGYLTWNGHLICGNCRRVYQTTNPSAERFAPDVCVCSANLRPQPREPFAGRPLCHLCFLGNVKSGRMA